MRFKQFLSEAPFSSPTSLPPAPGGAGIGMGGIPGGPGGLGGGMPPPPIGGMGGMGGGLGGPPMPGMPGQPGQQQPKAPKELKSTDVWSVLEELLNMKEHKPKQSSGNKNNNMVNSPKHNHLMS